MRPSSKVTGNEWCSPTKELKNSQLIKLVGETRKRGTDNLEVEVVREDVKPIPIEALFPDSAPVKAPIEASLPVSIEGSNSRFKIDASAIDAIEKEERRHPAREHVVLRVLRAIVWLAIGVGGGMSVPYWT